MSSITVEKVILVDYLHVSIFLVLLMSGNKWRECCYSKWGQHQKWDLRSAAWVAEREHTVWIFDGFEGRRCISITSNTFFTLSQYQTDSGYTTLPSLTFLVSLFLHPPWKSTSFFTSQSPSGQSWITASEQVLQDSYGRGSESRIFQYLPMYLLATIFTYLVILTK